MNKANIRIRTAAKEAHVRLWEVAEKYGVSEFYFSRKMRHEMPQEEQQRIIQIISDIKTSKERG